MSVADSVLNPSTNTMASRPLIIATLLGATVGVPYLTSHSSTSEKNTNGAPVATGFAPSGGAAVRLPATAMPLPAVNRAPSAMPYASQRPIDGAQFTSVNQIFRFDVTKEWVYQNWTRKSTGPTDV